MFEFNEYDNYSKRNSQTSLTDEISFKGKNHLQKILQKEKAWKYLEGNHGQLDIFGSCNDYIFAPFERWKEHKEDYIYNRRF